MRQIPRKVLTFRGRILYHDRGKGGAFFACDIAVKFIAVVSKCRKIKGF